MRILAVITARQGSKRLPGKNIKNLGGKPLINWTIEAARDIDGICDLLVSTDSIEIARIAEGAGAFVPWIRPPELATDTTESADVVIHALNWYEQFSRKVEGVMLLQPTSPFRSKSTIVRGISEYQRNQNSTVIGVSHCRSENLIMFSKDGQLLDSLSLKNSESKNLGFTDDLYCPNGTMYLISPENLRKHKSFFKGSFTLLHVTSEIESLDIDTSEDWLMAEAALN